MKQYIEELKKQLQEVMERPASLGRAEEVTVYADAICALHKLGGDHFRESTKMMKFTEDDAKEWTARMENTDGTTGQHCGRTHRPILRDGVFFYARRRVTVKQVLNRNIEIVCNLFDFVWTGRVVIPLCH